MKKLVILTGMIVTMSLLVSCGRSEALEKPEYPLSVEQVQEAMDSCGIELDIEADETYASEGAVSFDLKDGNFSEIALNSVGTESERALLATFPMSTKVLPKDAFHGSRLEDAGPATALLSVLFGGFLEESDLYDMIMKAYENGDFEETDVQDHLTWEAVINGISCSVGLEYVPELEEMYLRTIELREEL